MPYRAYAWQIREYKQCSWKVKKATTLKNPKNKQTKRPPTSSPVKKKNQNKNKHKKRITITGQKNRRKNYRRWHDQILPSSKSTTGEQKPTTKHTTPETPQKSQFLHLHLSHWLLISFLYRKLRKIVSFHTSQNGWIASASASLLNWNFNSSH